MDESALESYFDKFIANLHFKMETEDEEEEKEEEEEDDEEEAFFRLLPDELLTLYQKVTETPTRLSRTVLPDSITRQKHISQNPTGGSTMLELVRPVRPETPVTQQAELIPRIQNVVSTVDLGCTLDLHFIARKAWNVEYKPQVYQGLIMRIREPRATALIYKSGKVVCTGARSAEQSRLAARKFGRIVLKVGFPVHFRNFKICNMMASCRTFPVQLENLALREPCSYEPELFPGLFYKGVAGISVRINASGKVSFIGGRSEAEILRAFDVVCLILSRYRRSVRS
ncbi:TATA-box-binding protein-like isoform X6 [Sebastes umbrosus]|uniref:TATA-box-binding protein-like isoform X6 n=1 Tax=Sebastes umbrosus TaxID=72105 RepID=UPI00189F6446|nr:TATA-box-binding protein-like isoform X6 [Sebastes umbrosus]